MRCAKYKKYLIPYAEGNLPERTAEPLRRHLASCKACSDELAELSGMVEVLKRTDYPAMQPAPNLRSRVMAQIAREPVRSSWFFGRLPAYSAAAAVLLLFAVVYTAYGPDFFARDAPPSPAPVSMPGVATDAQDSVKEQVSSRPSKSPSPEKSAAKMPGMPGGTAAVKPAGTPSAESPALPAPALKSVSGAPEPAAPAEAVEKRSLPPRVMAQGGFGGTQQSSEFGAPPAPPDSLLDVAEEPVLRGAGNVMRDDDKAFRSKMESTADRLLILEKKMREYPNSPTVLRELLAAYRESGRSEDEYAIAQRLVDLDPENPSHWFALGQSAEKVKRPKVAADAYRKALEKGLSGPSLNLARERLGALEE